MTLEQQWCDNPRCRDFQKVRLGNVEIFSHRERRYYCTTCRHTWSFDKGSAFETLRSSRVTVAHTLSELGERASLRATARLRHHPVNTVLDWLDVAGAHVAAVSAHVIQGLHVDYVLIFRSSGEGLVKDRPVSIIQGFSPRF